MARASITFNGATGPEVSAVVNEPWQSTPTASRTINGTTVHARFAATAGTHSRVALDTDGGARTAGVRTTSTRTSFDEHGMAIEVDHFGDDAVADDQKCTLTDYIRNTNPATGVWLTAFVKRVRSFAVGCTTAKTSPLSEQDIISDDKTLYDNTAYGTAPTKGDVTEVQQLKAYSAGSPTHVTVARSNYDQYGRVIGTWDVDNRHTATAYTPAADGPVAQMVVTNPMGWTTTTVLEPAWGTPMAVTDVNGKLTEATRDGLGRTTAVWKPGRSRAGGHTPHATYSYLIRTGGANAVTTNSINATGTGYITSIALYDGLLRARQSQTPDAAVAGARIVTDTFYDTAGRAFKATNPYTMSGTPSPDLYRPKPPEYSGPEALPGWSVNLFDGAGRVTDSILYSRNVEKWRTRTAYTGDRVDVTPPAAGTATSTITNAAGQTIALRQYHGPTPTGGRDTTTYSYDRKAQLVRVTDPVGNHWDYAYDIRGRKFQTDDPDAGRTTTTYDDAGRIVTRKDANNLTVAYTYDALGRKTSLRDGSVTGPKRAEWVYDSVAKGQLAKSVRYVQRDTVYDAYTTEILSYGHQYEPGIVRYSLPASETGFGATVFSYSHGHNTDGSLSTTRIPAAGGLALEVVNYGYNSLSLPSTLSGGGGTLVTDTGYTNYGEPNIVTLQNSSGKIAQVGYYYHDDGTRRLAEIKTTSAAVPTTYADLFYTYDPAGNITKIADAVSGDNQCFRHDQLRRLTEAWTPANGNCATNPTLAALGGPAKYWQQWTFDAIGNRKTQTNHVAATTATYTYPTAGGLQPHALSKVDYTGAVSRTDNYTYDPAGNTKTRPAATGGQTLTWDAEGHLEKSIDPSGTTSFIYDADGNRLLRKDPGGKTLYLPQQEIRYNGATATCTRYYTHAGKTVAMRTSAGITWLSGDAQNTSNIAITATSQTTALRWQDPYGNPRGASGTWPAAMDKGLVGGTKDNTGLTHLGAREYDPQLGRFISVDPIMDLADPQQWHAYTYSNSSPITFSDPTGLRLKEEKSGGVPWSGTGAHLNPKPKKDSWARGFFIGAAKTTRDVAYYGSLIGLGDMLWQTGKNVYNGMNQRAQALGAGEIGWGEYLLGGAADLFNQPFMLGGLINSVTSMIETANTAINGETAEQRGEAAGNLTVELVASIAGSRMRLPRASGCHSFHPATPVLMADGSTKPIEDVAEGDTVLATEPTTGETTGKPVTQLHNNQDWDLADVTVLNNTTGETTTIHTTWTHPFWNASRQTWVDAADLLPGTALTAPDGSTPLTVIDVHTRIGNATMRDLTVANIHTYYILAGETPVLVHNCGDVDIYKAPGKGMTDKLKTDGFTPEDFPGSGSSYPDGRAYFGIGEKGKAIAEDYATRGGYDGTVIKMTIPKNVWDEHFAKHVGAHNGVPRTEIGIPNSLFGILNRFERVVL
ncbi:polymorphic toxin-type HINT domain-containing protein [Allorhizocola rhizosphaerae]|uniref:polymorphic toxin-type HINT domain-containing protein n=1 Tax=Allorhizocola rhizosphaerae TaxID=1872709 RepID=UPI001B8B416F|nr:polymorphic toxin-type HINT domain-containing protein [Allorhizocola rhizosphaerae]